MTLGQAAGQYKLPQIHHKLREKLTLIAAFKKVLIAIGEKLCFYKVGGCILLR